MPPPPSSGSSEAAREIDVAKRIFGIFCESSPLFSVVVYMGKMKEISLKLLALASLLLTTACAGYAPLTELIGQPRENLIAQMGLPEREYSSKEFQKLHYPRGPAGWHTYFVYVDKDNKIARWEQVLTEKHFDGLAAGMTRDEVIDTIGISRLENRLANDRGYIWYYRYETTQCRSFVIEFDHQNIVRGTGYIHRSGRKCNYVGP
jgi:hypothetical protein